MKKKTKLKAVKEGRKTAEKTILRKIMLSQRSTRLIKFYLERHEKSERVD